MNKEKNYLQEREKTLTPLLAIEEASRCLLCHDAPCSKACPAESDPAKFIRSLRFRNIKGGVETIRENNILGGICARVCPTTKYCEGACSRCGIDKPIQIAKLQRYLTDYEEVTGFKVLEAVEITKEPVAIIGSGPSGLAAGTELALKGYDVTIFEQQANLGGWLSYGIPPERLPQSVVDHEIQYIKDLGVKFKTNQKLGRDFSIDDLKSQGFKAILIAIGMQNSKMVDIPGIDLNGVLKGTDYLSQAKSTTGDVNLGEHIVVIGGGDVAIDCAVTSKLLGCDDVKIVYRRTLEKMPADPIEKTHLQSLDIPVFTGFKPSEIVGNNGNVTNFKATGMFDNSIIDLPVDRVIFAIGQEADDVNALANVSLKDNYESSEDGIFAAGDIIDGDKTVVYSVKQGKDVAKKIDEYLSNNGGRK